MTQREHDTVLLILRSVSHYTGRDWQNVSLTRHVCTGPNDEQFAGDISIDAVEFKPTPRKSA